MKLDPHVHLRDGKAQKHKETLINGFLAAWEAGLSGVFEMPNTVPSLTTEKSIHDRIKAGEKALDYLKIPLFHGIIAGITDNRKQIENMVNVWKKMFPAVTGLKMFAGHSTGNMGIIELEDQQNTYRILSDSGYTGVLMVHCEKESLLRPDFFDPGTPSSHLSARPPAAEITSIKDQIELAKKVNFAGTLHICHVTLPESLDIIEKHRETVPFNITCGITPHHALLSVEDMAGPLGLLLKVNPPLRSKKAQERMLKALLKGKITWIESDHAPHTKDEKMKTYPSGIPVLPFYNSFIKILTGKGLDKAKLEDLTFNNITKTFGLSEKLFTENPLDCENPKAKYSYNPFALGMEVNK